MAAALVTVLPLAWALELVILSATLSGLCLLYLIVFTGVVVLLAAVLGGYVVYKRRKAEEEEQPLFYDSNSTGL